MNPYLKTPAGIMSVLEIFREKNLRYILFKCEHIFEGQNKNLDILFENTEEYHSAAALLKQRGFIVYLSEKIERYKTMYCGFIEETMYFIHLHREIAWHGIIALEKKTVFSRGINVHPLVIIPSLEDSILIHAAHVLFENFRVRGRERDYFIKLSEPTINKEYILWQLQKNGWYNGFQRITNQEREKDKDKYKEREEINNLTKTELFLPWTQKLWKEPATVFYLFQKLLRIPLRKISFRRQGCLIALIGPNGSGKTTLTRKLFQEFQPITAQFNGQKGYYFGWDPILPTTRLLKRFQGSQGAYQRLNEKSPSSFSLFKEAIIVYTFIEYLSRYYLHLYPALRRKNMVITDRYYYDAYAQHAYAEKSVLQQLFIKIFPKPDFIYLLHASSEIMSKRDKSTAIFSTSIKRSELREVHPFEDLNSQVRRYALLQSKIGASFLSTENNLEINVQKIMEETWKKLVKNEA